jgi:disulfide bond formation protein DsbB
MITITPATTATNSPATPLSLKRRAGFAFNHVFLLGYCAVLLSGLVLQFAEQEHPCPLCIVQRMAIMLCAMGPAYVIARSRTGQVMRSDVMTGFGMALVGAVAGLVMSARQVLLHIMPPDPGVGSTLLGLHLYTWGLVTFVVALAGCGFYLLVSDELVPGPVHYGWASRIALWLFALIVLANAIVVFFEEGMHWFLPATPVVYRLVH